MSFHAVALGGLLQATTGVGAELIRFVEAADGSAALETAIVHLEDVNGVKVDLVGAVHVADGGYYEALNERFSQYDAVLYELIGSPEPGGGMAGRAAGREGRLHWIGMLQAKMKEVLELEGQLEGIDYGAANFVHADMSSVEFSATQSEQGESFLGLWWKAATAAAAVEDGQAMKEQPGLIRLLELIMSGKGADELKRIAGEQFDDVERLMEGLEADGGTVIVGRRNEVALGVLDEEMSKGRRHLAIFYGAAHLPDMLVRLKARGFVVKRVEWQTAWAIAAPAEAANPHGGGKGP